MTTFFRYVPHGRVTEMAAKGWSLVHAMQDNRHGQYAVLMKWEGAGEPDA